jgi:hypothetical protein
MGSPKAVNAQNDIPMSFSAAGEALPFQNRGEKCGLAAIHTQ